MTVRSRGHQWLPSDPFPAPDAFLSDEDPDQAPWTYLIDRTDPALYSIIRAGLELETRYGFELDNPYVIERAVATGRRRHAEKQDTIAQCARLSAQAAADAMGSTVVYYMRMGNRVKIGYSTNLPLRVATIVPEELMVIEPGGYELEQLRHRQFRPLRVVGEWFRLESPLSEHIEQLRDQAVATITSQ